MNVSTLEKDRVLFRTVCLDMLCVIDTPFSLSVYLQIEYNLSVTSEVLPCNYLDPESLQKDLQALALFRKNAWFFSHIPSFVLHNAAEKKFLDAENQNRQTNDRLRSISAKAPFQKYFHSARQFCNMILGPVQIGRLEFSSGANTTLSGKDAHLLGKLKTPPHCTGLAYEHVIKMSLQEMPHYALACGLLKRDSTSVQLDLSKVEILDGNRFSSVPKDWRTNRPICLEPHGNMLIQKGYGDRIRSCLKAFGYDLNHLQEKHGELARVSSKNDSFATIDLASASDTISRELVREILPPDWFDVLDKLRCRKTFMSENEFIVNEKFSSMGNGFTFELETLLFLCLALACRSIHGDSSNVVSVYGDDIIVSRELAEPLVGLLSFSGLSVNSEKTFLDGPFKESCGYDYYNGCYVRPVYLKELPDNEILQVVAFANRVRKIAHYRFNGMFCDSRFRKHWLRVLRRLPKHLRLIGPTFLGDTVLHGTTVECATLKTKGNITRVKIFKKRYHNRQLPGTDAHLTLCYALYGGLSSGVVPRGSRFSVTSSTTPLNNCSWEEGYDWF